MKRVGLFHFILWLLIAKSSSAQQLALLPLPVELKWETGSLPVSALSAIRWNDPSLAKTAALIHEYLKPLGKTLALNPAVSGKPELKLRMVKQLNKIQSAEGYHLLITDRGIELTALSDTGIYYGWQTLQQLLVKGNSLQKVEIYDEPAFPWRGYMVDVGRNYQTMELLKAQIDRMAAYKLNTFHFHVTEDIAWRLELPGYPALTSDSTMLRDPGMYYSVNEVKELIRYCRDRYIRFILEIDMPGHSAAFERATGLSMQSREGVNLVKDILKKVVKEYAVDILHIGGDEVKITNQEFLPGITRLLDSLGVKHIGWSPGGNIPASTIRQLWMTDAPIEPGKQYLDSRHLYLNHMDPHEAVVTLFHRQIGDRKKADTSMLGGIICVWNDRRLINENFHLLLNGVYPSMLAFAERSWRGGGLPKWTAVIGDKNSPETLQFTPFEGRLLKHKKIYFSGEPFPYFAQSKLEWNLFGPFPNNGNLKQVFDPELAGFFPNNPSLPYAQLEQPLYCDIGGRLL